MSPSQFDKFVFALEDEYVVNLDQLVDLSETDELADFKFPKGIQACINKRIKRYKESQV